MKCIVSALAVVTPMLGSPASSVRGTTRTGTSDSMSFVSGAANATAAVNSALAF